MKVPPINIIDSEKEIELYTGIFSVSVLGGWDVIVNDFSFILKNTISGKIIKPKITQWKTQSFLFNEKAKKIMILDIPERGNYTIEFKNQERLKVWKSDIPYLYRLFRQPIEKQYVQISIH